MTIRPARLPIGRRRARQGDIGSDPAQRFAAAFLGRHADHRAEKGLGGGRCFFILAAARRRRSGLFLAADRHVFFDGRRRGAMIAAATTGATLLGAAATADLLPARIRQRGLRHRKADGAGEVREQRHACDEAMRERSAYTVWHKGHHCWKDRLVGRTVLIFGETARDAREKQKMSLFLIARAGSVSDGFSVPDRR